ncbi:MAG: hypothetical protein LBC17_04695 [Lactobacillaceae bacterium]|jgi:hypothetical protein|nr:hypothetical protein [Lactobacillaceae bacterium]
MNNQEYIYVVISQEPEDKYTLQAYLRGVFVDKKEALRVASEHLPYWYANVTSDEKIKIAEKYVIATKLDKINEAKIRVAFRVFGGDPINLKLPEDNIKTLEL